jgi:hypothetical protein
MDFETFEQSLDGQGPPAAASDLIKALWYERKGDWTKAHEIAQDIDTPDAARVHAYLHRREGDNSNAAYWDRQAGQATPRCNMDDEWRALVKRLLVTP